MVAQSRDAAAVNSGLLATFVGFTSVVPITRLIISTATTEPQIWVTYDNFYVGSLEPVGNATSSWRALKVSYR